MLGEFRTTPVKSGLTILTYGPKDKTQLDAGVPMVAIALNLDMDRMQFDPDHFSRFLNAALAASHGNRTFMEALLGPQPSPQEKP